MKKYFVKETEEELEFGDILEATFVKELEDGRVTIEKELTFTEDTIDGLLALGVIEEVEEEDENQSTIHFCDDSEEEELAQQIEDCIKEIKEAIEMDRKEKEVIMKEIEALKLSLTALNKRVMKLEDSHTIKKDPSNMNKPIKNSKK